MSRITPIPVFFIPYNTPSSKNNKQWTGKFLVWSKLAQKYRKDTKKYWIEQKEEFLKECNYHHTYPYKISFKFVRNSRRRFDYVNPLQTTLDLMVEHGWLLDDCADIIIPIFEPYEYNKDTPGVYITIL